MCLFNNMCNLACHFIVLDMGLHVLPFCYMHASRVLLLTTKCMWTTCDA
jgi:hypothetical protein